MSSNEPSPSIATLVPQLAVEMSDRPGNRHRRIDGSMLSADISGFTALTEKLAEHGKAGAEEITELLNFCFADLIEAAYDYGGEVIKFGGDAILVLFRADEHPLRAASAATAMHAALSTSSAARAAELSMTVGVSQGPFECFLVGSGQRELLLCGVNASQVVHLESQAAGSQTLVSQMIGRALPDGAGVQLEDGSWAITGDPGAPITGPRPRTVIGADLSDLVPSAVADQFHGFAELGGEHRPVTVGFLSVGGVDDFIEREGALKSADALGALVDEVVGAGAELGVTALHTDIADGGLKILVCSGAPMATDVSTDALIELGLRIVGSESPFTLRVGVNRGRVFAGFLGSPFRRTYTLMGDSVNTAARLLTRTEDREVLALREVLEDTRAIYHTEDIEPFWAKGISNPIRAVRVGAATGLTRRQSAPASFTGRGRDLEALQAAVEAKERLVCVVGRAGLGKTRLLDELRLSVGDDRPCLVANCSPYAATTPYQFLSEIVRQAAGIATDAEPREAGAQLHRAVVRLAPELEPMLPILAIPARAEVAETEESAAIDPIFLRDRIKSLLADFLFVALPPGAILILDDAQWADPASVDFFAHALERMDEGQWTLILSSRPTCTWPADTLDPGSPTIELGPVADAAIRTMVIEASTVDLPDAAIDRVVGLADGNPLFALELTKTVEGTGDADISDTVEKLVAARFDALDGESKRVLRVASVLGTEFRRSDLSAALGAATLDLAPLAEFLVVDDRAFVAFRNGLFRDVAYEGLPFAQRKRLHAQVGDHLESQALDPRSISALLSLHFYEAGDNTKAWTYGVAAGDTAATAAANVEAAAAYDRALASSARLRSIDRGEVARVALALGECCSILGEYDRAERAYQRARRASEAVSVQVNTMLLIGELRERQGRYGQARRWYERAEAAISANDSRINEDEERLLQSAMWYQRAGLHHREGNHQQGIVAARLALGWAEDANDLKGMANALHRVHLNTVYLGREDRIRYGERALELFVELGDYERQASVLNNLGIGSYFGNRWSEAADYYDRATEAGLRAGSVIDGMLGTVNSGEILSDQGHWAEAVERLETARRNFDGGRYPMGAAMVRMFLGTTHFRQGELDLAMDLLQESADELASLGLSETEIDARSRLLEVELATGRAGLAACEAFLARLGPDHGLARRLRYLRGMAALTEGRWAEFRSDVVTLAGDQEGYGRAMTLRLLAHGDGQAAERSWVAEANRVFDSLGVVRLAPLPAPGSAVPA